VVDVYTREFLTIVVVDCGQPVVMLAAAICLKVGASFPSGHLNVSSPKSSRDVIAFRKKLEASSFRNWTVFGGSEALPFLKTFHLGGFLRKQSRHPAGSKRGREHEAQRRAWRAPARGYCLISAAGHRA
jgi:hypothetical protein